MSADNWAICPKCRKLEIQYKKELEEDAKELYGKISPEDYLQLLKEIPDKINIGETLREDYEMGVDGRGEFYTSYSCSCDKCGFKYSFNHKERLSLEIRRPNNMKPLQISAKALGAMAMPDFCPRCFWIKLHAKKLPWQIFPGIFSTIDAYTKKIVHAWIDRGIASDMLKKYKVTGYQKSPHWSKFKIDTKSGIILSGAVDDIWTVEDGIVIPDYKTAKFTENADKLLPMYRTQLNGYAKIAEAIGMGKVIAIPLIYMEPQTEQDFVDASDLKGTDWNMTFWPKILDLELDIESIDSLLEKAKVLYDGSIPDGVESCKDCLALGNIVGMI